MSAACKTYAEQKGQEPFDWNTYLDRAIKSRRVKGTLWIEAGRCKAYQWVTCACGNQCSVIPRSREGVPKDARLWELGGLFAHEIANSRWGDAKGVLKAIEERSAVVIKQTLAKKLAKKRKLKKVYKK